MFLITRTELGTRPLAPDVGIEDPTFASVDLDDLAAQLEALEDRAVVDVTLTAVDAFGEQFVEIAVGLAAEDNAVGGNVAAQNMPTPVPLPTGGIDGGPPTGGTEGFLDGGSPLDGGPDTIDGGTP